MDTLTILEESQLAKCEREVEEGIRSFIKVGRALLTIRDGRLYREAYATFEDYCQGRWQIKRSYAYELIDAAEVVENVSGIPDKPTAASQVRPLTKLPPEEQPAAWQEAVETAPEGKPTAKHVAEVVARRIAETKVEPEPEPEAEDIDDSADIEFDDEGRIVEEPPSPDPEKAAEEARRSELRRLISDENQKLVIARMLFDSCNEPQRVSVSISWNEWWKET